MIISAYPVDQGMPNSHWKIMNAMLRVTSAAGWRSIRSLPFAAAAWLLIHPSVLIAKPPSSLADKYEGKVTVERRGYAAPIQTREFLSSERLTYNTIFYGTIFRDDRAGWSKGWPKGLSNDATSQQGLDQAADELNLFGSKRGDSGPYIQVTWDPVAKKIPKAAIFCYDINQTDAFTILQSVPTVEQNVFPYLDRPVANVEVLDLFAARIYNYRLIARQFTNVRVLALPYLGCDFRNPEMVLPQNIETLIVHNSALGEEFFQKISQLKKLRKLVLHKCDVVNHEREKFDGAPLPYSHRARDRYLAGLTPSLEHLVLSECEGYLELFLCLANRWENLRCLELRRSSFSFLPNMGGMWGFAVSEQAATVRNEFPKLKRFVVWNYEIRGEGLPGNISKYFRDANGEIDVHIVIESAYRREGK